jgi:ABC-type dipeptide/oligopeptide/nickel transport system ATPase component
MIKINDLTVCYYKGSAGSGAEEFTAVDDVRLKIPDNSIFALVGESGCGKTTLGLAITQLIDPKDGRIKHGSVVLDDKNILKFSEKQLRDVRGKKISYVFQEPASSFNPVFTIGEQIDEALIAHGIAVKKNAKDIAMVSLRQARLEDPQRVYRSYPHQLSGGMKQRAMIAMAISMKPKLLIADEPTTALDIDTEKEILDLLLSLRSDLCFSVLFITHNIRIVKDIADEVAVMHRGRIVETGPAGRVLRFPKHEYTKLLVLSMPENIEKS